MVKTHILQKVSKKTYWPGLKHVFQEGIKLAFVFYYPTNVIRTWKWIYKTNSSDMVNC